MDNKVKEVIGYVVAILIGLPLSFFGVFVSVFADGGGMERTVTVGVILIIYGILGVVFGFFGPQTSWRWGMALSGPAVLILALYSLDESGRALFYLVYMAAVAGISCGGAYLSSRIKLSKKK